MYPRRRNQAKERLQSCWTCDARPSQQVWMTFFNLNFSPNTCSCDRYLLQIQEKIYSSYTGTGELAET